MPEHPPFTVAAHDAEAAAKKGRELFGGAPVPADYRAAVVPQERALVADAGFTKPDADATPILHLTTYTVEVLSEQPIDDIEFDAAMWESLSGGFSRSISGGESYPVYDRATAIRLVNEQSSDPAFFGLEDSETDS